MNEILLTINIIIIFFFALKFIYNKMYIPRFFHGDLKPENVILIQPNCLRYELKVIDFSSEIGKYQILTCHTKGYMKPDRDNSSELKRIFAELDCAFIIAKKFLEVPFG